MRIRPRDQAHALLERHVRPQPVENDDQPIPESDQERHVHGTPQQPGERAGLLSAYFVLGYLAFSVPALAAGFLAPVIGLTRTADFYGAGVVLLAATTLIVNLWRRRRA